jgi:hypothetical protein
MNVLPCSYCGYHWPDSDLDDGLCPRCRGIEYQAQPAPAGTDEPLTLAVEAPTDADLGPLFG